MPSDPTCAVTGCGNRDAQGRCTAAVGVFGEHPLACAHGRFATTVERELGDMGEWMVRQYADGPAKATLRGRLGAVEVWGARHAHEVWFVERGTKAETMLCGCWALSDGSLRDAVERGCAMAGVQTRMGV